jgi:3-oxoacyl-[acyl-carrier protein] reductase
MRLGGKAAIITGGGRGLGKASAIAMAREGASVLVLSRTARELKETRGAIGHEGGKALSITADVSKPGDIERAVERALSAFGRIDVLMNNAGVIGPVKPLHKVTGREWEKVSGINLASVLMFSRAVIPHMARQGGGKIINVTSGLGVAGMSPLGAYSITKAGVIHLTRIMAGELKGDNIQVNGLDPGVMDTRMQDDVRAMGPAVLGDDVYAEFLAMKEKGHLSPPGEAARLAVFLASEDSNSITGENGTEDCYRSLGYRVP